MINLELSGHYDNISSFVNILIWHVWSQCFEEITVLHSTNTDEEEALLGFSGKAHKKGLGGKSIFSRKKVIRGENALCFTANEIMNFQGFGKLQRGWFGSINFNNSIL